MLLTLLSPSKTLDFSSNVPAYANINATEPCFPQEIAELIQLLCNFSSNEIAKLMALSPKLSELNYQRFQNFYTQPTKPALYAYKGDVYEGFTLESYQEQQIDFANKTLAIISGLYGIIKPLELIRAYRLEMSINLANKNGKNLYRFWGQKLTAKLNEYLVDKDFIINLASQEYSSSIDFSALNKPVINISFKESHKGDYKVIGIYAKKARGVMADYIIRQAIVNPNLLKEFDLNDYKFAPHLSSEAEYVFIR